MANNQNTMRDMKRSILKAVRDSQKTKQDAMDEYVAARVNIKSLEERLEEAREKATLLRRKAKDAGNTSAELKTADDLIDARWKETWKAACRASRTVGKAVNREPAGTASAAETAARPVPVRRRAPRVLAGRHRRQPPAVNGRRRPRFRDGRETGVHGQKENGFGPATVRRPGGGGNPGSRRLVSAHHRVPR